MVYEEIKTIRRLLEELVEHSLENIFRISIFRYMLPTEEISEEEIKEKGEYVPLSEVKKKT